MKFTHEQLYSLDTTLARIIADGLEQFLAEPGFMGGCPGQYMPKESFDGLVHPDYDDVAAGEAGRARFDADIRTCIALMRRCDSDEYTPPWEEAGLAFACLFGMLWD